MQVTQEQIDEARSDLRILGRAVYGDPFTDRILRDNPMTLIRIMCEDAVHDDWGNERMFVLRGITRTFRAAQNR